MVKSDGKVKALFPFQRIAYFFMIDPFRRKFDAKKENTSNQNMRSSIEKLKERLMEFVDTSNPNAVEKSSGYQFFRTIPNQPSTIENRFVSDDSGNVAVLLFLNACNVGQTQNCYLQTATYRVNIVQEGLNIDENFTVQGEKIQSFSIVQFLSTLSNNTDAIIVIIVGLGVAIVLVVTVIFFFLRKMGVLKLENT